MDIEKLRVIRHTFDGSRAIDLAARLAKTDSEFTFPAFHKTSQTAAAMMEDAGLTDVEVFSFKADGKTVYGDWIVPRAWDVNDAKLWIKEKDSFTTIADRKKNLCNVMMYSAPTPGGKPLECSIVSERNTNAWKGNLVFADNPQRFAPVTLIRNGAIGVVTDYLPEWKHCRSREDVYDTVLWNNSYLAPANEHNLIGFQVTPREGDRIRSLLKQKRNKIQAKLLVDSELYDGTIDFVTGVYPGWSNSDEEIGVFAHLYEPGANDNASGCALGLEAIRVINDLKKKQKLKSPKRSIRLCYTFEIYGTLAFFEAYPEKMKNIIAGINPDMVGPDMEKCRSRLHVHGTPDSACSYVDTLIVQYIEYAFSYNYMLRWSEQPFFINDNFITDPAIDIPTPALVCLRDRYYHSSMDTADNLSPDTMHAIGSAMTAYLHDISCGEYETAVKLADLILAREMTAIERKLRSIRRPPLEECLTYSISVAEARLKSLMGFLMDQKKKGALAKHIGKAVNVLKAFGQSRKLMLSKDPSRKVWKVLLDPPEQVKKKAQKMFPAKKVLGTVTSVNLSGIKKGGSSWSYAMNAPLFWANGKRSVYEIWRNWLFEFGMPHSLESLIGYFEQLEDDGHAVIKRKN
ncbi:DUF4910 domain-containing protein [Planctomycetota bacterium]